MRLMISLLLLAQTLTAASQTPAPAPQASAPAAPSQNAGQTYDHIEWGIPVQMAPNGNCRPSPAAIAPPATSMKSAVTLSTRSPQALARHVNGTAMATPAVQPSVPTVIAVLLSSGQTADSKAFTARVERAEANMTSGTIAFLQFDLSTPASTHQASLSASLLDLTDLFEKYRAAADVVLIVDPKTKQLLTTIPSNKSASEISQILTSESTRPTAVK